MTDIERDGSAALEGKIRDRLLHAELRRPDGREIHGNRPPQQKLVILDSHTMMQSTPIDQGNQEAGIEQDRCRHAPPFLRSSSQAVTSETPDHATVPRRTIASNSASS